MNLLAADAVPATSEALESQSAGKRVTDRLLVAALLCTLILWSVPYGWIALYPFKIFATWLHESSHGLLMLVTGAGLDRMEIFRDTSGMAHPARAVSDAAQAVISSAGYMGTAFFGAVFMILGRTDRGARWILAGLGAFMALAAVFFVRNLFGGAVVAAEGLVLVGLARFGGERPCAFLLNLLAAQSCINAVLDIRVLFGATLYVDEQPRLQSDADVMANLTGLPSGLWAALWLCWSFALFFVALRAAPKRRGATLRP